MVNKSKLEPLRILYVSSLHKGSTDLQRKKAFENLGHTIIPFDTDVYKKLRFKGKKGRIGRTLTHRLIWGPAVWSLNRDLVKFIKSLEYDMVWLSKGTWIYPSTVETLKRNGKSRVVHYTPDPAIVFHRTRHFMRSIMIYDVLITTKSWELPSYRKQGASRVVYAHKSVNLNLLKPYDVSSPEYDNLRSDVCFIGHCESHYINLVRAAYDTGANVAVWGADQWQWYRHIVPRMWYHPWLKQVVRGGAMWREDYAKAICCAKIGLGLLSKLVPETVTQRSVEIPACGTFFLAERTDEHLEYFEEGKEAEFFSSEEEMQDKIKYYLAHDEERERIARAGRERCLRSRYDNESCMRRLLEEVFRD